MSEGRQVEDRHAADPEHGVSVQHGPQILVLDHRLRLDGDAGHPRVSLGIADGAGREEGVVELVDVLTAAHRRCRHQARAVAEAGGEIDGRPGFQIGIKLEMAGENDVAGGVAELNLPARRGDPQSQIIADSPGPQGRVPEPGQNAVGTGAVSGDDVAGADGGIRLDIDGVRGQSVSAGPGRAGGGRGHLRQGTSRQAGPCNGSHTGQKPVAQGSQIGRAADTLHTGNHSEGPRIRPAGGLAGPISRLRYRTAR